MLDDAVLFGQLIDVANRGLGIGVEPLSQHERGNDLYSCHKAARPIRAVRQLRKCQRLQRPRRRGNTSRLHACYVEGAK